jgi:nitrogen fixation NifU-like protein
MLGSDGESKMNTNREGEITSIETAFYEWLNSLQWKKSLVAPDGHACLTGKCGETIEIFLNFEGEHVKEAGYRTNGCISSKVCAALTAQMARGKTADELLEITAQTILSQLGEFPKNEEHCAFLAAESLQEALHSYMLKQGRKGSEEVISHENSSRLQGGSDTLQDPHQKERH